MTHNHLVPGSSPGGTTSKTPLCEGFFVYSRLESTIKTRIFGIQIRKHMKKLILIMGLIVFASCQQNPKMNDNINPFFQEWNTQYHKKPKMRVFCL